jgi:hypothetical protein
MTVRKKHFVTFYSPGTFFHETTTKEIAERDPKLAVAMAETILERYGAKPWGFCFESRMCADPVPDGMGGEMPGPTKPIPGSETGYYFLGGTVITLDDVEARAEKSEDVLRSNMRNNWPICVDNRNSWRSVNPFTEKDVIVDARGTIVERGDDPKHVAYRAEVQARPR